MIGSRAENRFGKIDIAGFCYLDILATTLDELYRNVDMLEKRSIVGTLKFLVSCDVRRRSEGVCFKDLRGLRLPGIFSFGGVFNKRALITHLDGIGRLDRKDRSPVEICSVTSLIYHFLRY